MSKCSRLLAVVAALLATQPNSSGQFAPGTVVVVKIGDGALTQSTANALPISLVRLKPDGTPAGAAVDLNAAAVAAGLNGFVNAGSTTSSNNSTGLSLSSDGSTLLLTGYNTAPGASVSPAGSGTIQRTVARVNVTSGAATFQPFNTSAAFSGGNVRAAASTDGVQVWVAGIGTPGGILYAPNATTSAPTQVLGGSPRDVEIAGGNLYVSVDAAINGYTGTPTTLTSSANPALTNGITGLTSAFGFQFVNRFNTPGTPGGVDTLYVVDNIAVNAPVLKRFTYDTGSARWVASGSHPINGNAGFSVAAVPTGNGTDVALYVDSGVGSNNSLVRYTDTTTDATAFSNLTADWSAPAGTNFTYRGVVVVPVPEPVTVVAVGAAALGLGRLARRARPDPG